MGLVKKVTMKLLQGLIWLCLHFSNVLSNPQTFFHHGHQSPGAGQLDPVAESSLGHDVFVSDPVAQASLAHAQDVFVSGHPTSLYNPPAVIQEPACQTVLQSECFSMTECPVTEQQQCVTVNGVSCRDELRQVCTETSEMSCRDVSEEITENDCTETEEEVCTALEQSSSGQGSSGPKCKTEIELQCRTEPVTECKDKVTINVQQEYIDVKEAECNIEIEKQCINLNEQHCVTENRKECTTTTGGGGGGNGGGGGSGYGGGNGGGSGGFGSVHGGGGGGQGGERTCTTTVERVCDGGASTHHGKRDADGGGHSHGHLHGHLHGQKHGGSS